MITPMLIVLVIIDILLLGVVFFLGKKRINSQELLQEITEERRFLTELRQTIKEEIDEAKSEIKAASSRVSSIATQVELELSGSEKALKEKISEIVDVTSTEFSKPFSQISEAEKRLDSMLRKINKEKFVLQKMLSQGQTIVKFFDSKVSYEDLLEELADKKYQDARALIAKGFTSEEIAKNLGISLSEIKQLKNLEI